MAKKKCIYCKAEIDANSVVDMCKKCMHGVWGPKMTEAIVSGMEKEKAKGNMELGRVGCDSSSESSINQMKRQVSANTGC
jgi:hypothetical protein